MTKHYNPFKMWGSYVGALLVAFFPIMHGSGDMFSIDIMGVNLIKKIIDGSLFNNGITVGIYGLFGSLFIIFVGFLLGWAIHSLFRRLK